MSPGAIATPMRGDSASRYSVETVATESALDSLEADWNRLSLTADHPDAFMTYGWFRAWAKQLTRKDRAGRIQPHVLVLRAGLEIVGVAPLARRLASRLIGLRKLEFVTNHSDYNDLIVGFDQAGQTEAAIDYLARTSRQWDVIDLRELRDIEGKIASIESALTRSGLSYQRFLEKDGCPYLPIDGDAESRLSGHVRRTLRRRKERAEAEGLRIRIIENPQREPDLLKKLLTLENLKHGHTAYAPFMSAYPEVFQSLFNTLGPLGWLYIALLEVGDRPIAFQLGFLCGDKIWDYTKAYDRSYSRFAPGTILLPELLNFGIERGFREYDFLRGEEQYKSVWSAGSHPRYRLLIWNRRGFSRIRKFIYHDLRTAIHRVLQKHA